MRLADFTQAAVLESRSADMQDGWLDRDVLDPPARRSRCLCQRRRPAQEMSSSYSQRPLHYVERAAARS
eukprot:670372-Pleurochrysis_carterae.AAC.1